MNRAAAIAAYIGCIVLANWLTTEFGLVPVGFGLMVTAGTYAAGAALLARDVVQDTSGRWVALGCVAAGAALSFVLADPFIALASAVAFLVAETADLLIYTPLRRKGWARAVLASNTAGALLDTLLFLSIAGFPITAELVAGQMVGKVLWATLLPVLAVVTLRSIQREQVTA